MAPLFSNSSLLFKNVSNFLQKVFYFLLALFQSAYSLVAFTVGSILTILPSAHGWPQNEARLLCGAHSAPLSDLSDSMAQSPHPFLRRESRLCPDIAGRCFLANQPPSLSTSPLHLLGV